MMAVEAAADTLGEMLIEVAEGRGLHGNEDIAAAVLRAGLKVLMLGEPDPVRLEEVGRALFVRLHDGRRSWTALSDVERRFWLDLAAAAVTAGDLGLLESLGGTAVA